MPQHHDVVVVHSSDLHLGSDTPRGGLEILRDVVALTRSLAADVLLLAGDVFDHNRLPVAFLDEAGRSLAEAGRPLVILPGNHDCLVADSVYRRGRLAEPENVSVLGMSPGTSSEEESVIFPRLDLEIWGRPHLEYTDMTPLAGPRPRSTRWQIAAAHGHWVQGPHDLHRAYRIHDDDIAACGADYVALGHWDRAAEAGDGRVPAYYSGSPSYAGTVNVVRFGADGTVRVTREAVARSAS